MRSSSSSPIIHPTLGRSVTRLGGLLTLAALTVLAPACASSGAPTSEGTVDQTKALAADFEKLKESLTETITALESVEASTDTTGFFSKKDVVVGDLETSCKTFKKARSKLVSQHTRTAKRKESLNKEFEAYVSGWQESMAEVQNKDLLEAAEKRRTEARKRFDVVRKELDGMGQRYDSMLSDLQGIETVLQNDMTAEGVNEIGDVIKGTIKKSEGVHEDLDKIIKALNDYGSALATRTPTGQTAE